MSSSSLSRVPEPKRRQLAATLALFAMLFLAIAAVAGTNVRSGMIRAFVVIALVVAVLLALMAWGVARSIRLDRAQDHARSVDAELDAAIEQAVRARGDSLCSCGHEHDPTELHVTDDPCDQDGRGVECTHSCATCVLAALRPAESASRPRPAPGRRPSPTPR